ncbi:isoprenoid biosynthesis glyoxalase ElbB [Nodularia spumigena]|uniref:isoprenoid biosynthesis glyoxalase ElbB n=1 Tax=Nodularia spumigena TaxID=70799 RepID=UPI002B1FCA23|nr:isoprenoid biosynthesis glyoxalase ElbB [Nodularia spumigena]MEA5616062.1 isoprenoid biosynthesis glyoxalase ElbB [Nodularia spumigena UHCC 0040]
MAKVGVILSGCGYLDGAEIHEATSVLIALSQRGVAWRCLAPRKALAVVDHATSEATGETRDVFTESARIARGKIDDLAVVKGTDYDAFILPGGFGAAKNLCGFAAEGPGCWVDDQVERVLREAHAAGRPIGFACIAPALGARVFGGEQPLLTIGHDAGTAAAIEKTGARHRAVGVREIVVDGARRFVSTPAYMEETDPGAVFEGVSKMVGAVLGMVD